MTGIRDHLTTEQRATDLDLIIDPGFLNHRKIQTIIGKTGMEIVDQNIRNLPELPEWQKNLRIDHIYTEVMLSFCEVVGIRTLQYNLATRIGPEQLSCSVERLGPCPDLYEKTRVVSKWIPPEGSDVDIQVEFHYSTAHICSDTLRSRLHDGSHGVAIIALLVEIKQDRALFEPLIMGFPWLRKKEEIPTFDIPWFRYSFFEHFIEDFDEFARVKDCPLPGDSKLMRNISENAFRQSLAEILGDVVEKHWGGESSDFYTAHLHLNGKPKTAAFLLKGPAHFAPMALNHLGKNNDQIVRLAQEPAQVLFVQHCHDITPPVRETLRAFAVQPGNPRRFCVVDGRDSLRLLKAYDLFDKALELSKRNRREAKDSIHRIQ
jgi:hypothetical protein